MTDPDAAIALLRTIGLEFATFCKDRGRASEADTRVKVIDRVLKEVLGWPEGSIKREDRVEAGYIDYTLRVLNRVHVAVEAKREGIAFELPTPSPQRNPSLNGALMTDAVVRDAILQVREYCESADQPIRYAIATNGYAWIIFRAIREDMQWKKGRARVYSGLDDIIAHFTSFWNMLSYGAIVQGKLDEEFGSGARVSRELHRVRDRLFSPELPLMRNRLHTQLGPIVRKVFEDIADQDEIEILKSCYVHNRSLRIVADDINFVIKDTVPAFLLQEGAIDIQQGARDSGQFGISLDMAVENRRKGQLFLLLGGVGAGKTTFLKRYQRYVAATLLDERALWFHVDFLNTPLSPAGLEDFLWSQVLDTIRERYRDLKCESWPNLKKAFARDIDALPRPPSQQGMKIAEEQIGEYLRSVAQQPAKYVPKLVRAASGWTQRSIVLFVDNVDQLSPDYQTQIFMLAQRVTETLGSTTIIAMREESYYTASIQKTFSAYNIKRFHIASPHFRRLIQARIQYALKLLERDSSRELAQLSMQSDGAVMDAKAIADFLLIVQDSIFEKNRDIGYLIEALCFGNMRLALQMFATFLTSGATEVKKMLDIYQRDGSYYVAFHEFLKSIMLGDRQYYDERRSPVLNLFECGSEKNAGHFTSMRLLAFLLEHFGDAPPEGRGYVELSRLIAVFEDVFDNREDFVACADRMLQNQRQLVEVNTRSTVSIKDATHIRITSAGWFYLNRLVNKFQYIDLVLQDTPLADTGVEVELRKAVQHWGNLSGMGDADKVQRLEGRFERVARFLEYLLKEEATEHARWGLGARSDVFARKFVPEITERFARQRDWIRDRLMQNREASLVEAQESLSGLAIAAFQSTPDEDEGEGDADDEHG